MRPAGGCRGTVGLPLRRLRPFVECERPRSLQKWSCDAAVEGHALSGCGCGSRAERTRGVRDAERKGPHLGDSGAPGRRRPQGGGERREPAGRRCEGARGLPRLLLGLPQLDGRGPPGRQQVRLRPRRAEADVQQDRDADRPGRRRRVAVEAAAAAAHVRPDLRRREVRRALRGQARASPRSEHDAAGAGRARRAADEWQAAVAGHFTARLTGTALRWHLRVGNTTSQPTSARIVLTGTGSYIRPVKLDCQRCVQPGSGFTLLTPAQSAALASGHATVVVPGAGGSSAARSTPRSSVAALAPRARRRATSAARRRRGPR